ncbi:hypothetical protein Scep_019991 [Stephania cephalantha]|uniref:Uncharacterized protein n=1 Tax=Stephania cephalantha TaxID=152367 RepID=A0AAP0ICB7_9MAGN
MCMSESSVETRDRTGREDGQQRGSRLRGGRGRAARSPARPRTSCSSDGRATAVTAGTARRRWREEGTPARAAATPAIAARQQHGSSSAGERSARLRRRATPAACGPAAARFGGAQLRRRRGNGVEKAARWHVTDRLIPDETQQQWSRRRDFD